MSDEIQGTAGTRSGPGWCCFQSGHRERYGIPRALNRVGVLDALVTDLWLPPGPLRWLLARGRAGRRMRDRYQADIPLSKVSAFTGRTLAWELAARLRGLGGDARVAARNAWWPHLAVRALKTTASSHTGYVFAYCYESRDLFHEARRLGLTPVLGQIDPGPVEDRKVAEIVRRWPQYRTPFQPGTEAYYARWREECRLAGHIVVNSEWSRTALAEDGVDPEKIAVCPLVYTPPEAALGWRRSYPGAFTAERPLKVLFLGQCILRKGIAETIGAAQALAGRPVEFTFVGNTDIENFKGHFGRGRIRYVTRVSREECDAHYRDADVFLFPTHSDGFGLTQLEARAWKLPIVASRFCADVTGNGKTGWRLEEVSVASLIQVIGHILDNPADLARRSSAIVPWHFGLEQLGGQLRSLPPVASSPSQRPARD